jgi:hypothetical protein
MRNEFRLIFRLIQRNWSCDFKISRIK